MTVLLSIWLLTQFSTLALDEERFYRGEVHALEGSGPTIALSNALNHLSYLYFEQREYRRAEEVSRRALAVERALPEPRRVEIAIGLNNLAAALSAQHRYAKATIYVRESLDLFSPADSPRVFALNTLGVLQLRSRRFELAAECFRQAADEWIATLGARNLNVAAALANLATTYSESGRSLEAIDLWHRVFEITEPQLAPDAPMRGALLRGYADTLARLGRKRESNSVRKQAKAIHDGAINPSRQTVDVGDLIALRGE